MSANNSTPSRTYMSTSLDINAALPETPEKKPRQPTLQKAKIIMEDEDSDQFIISIDGERTELFYNDRVIFYDEEKEAFAAITGTDSEWSNFYTTLHDLYTYEILNTRTTDPLVDPSFQITNDRVLYLTKSARKHAKLTGLPVEKIVVIRGI